MDEFKNNLAQLYMSRCAISNICTDKVKVTQGEMLNFLQKGLLVGNFISAK